MPRIFAFKTLLDIVCIEDWLHEGCTLQRRLNTAMGHALQASKGPPPFSDM
jgi:hypothetical protein